MLNMARRLRHKALIWWLRRAGMCISLDCRIFCRRTGFGTEPYLIEIGKHVTISGDCTLLTHDGGTWVFRQLPQYRDVVRFGTIRILDNCFIGAKTIILPGVTIGPNAVVGAGSVVTKDVPPGTVYAGNPAHFICSVEAYAEKCLRESPKLKRYTGTVEHRAAVEAAYWGAG